ncbi:MAG: 50S ribosomal protein L18 [Methanobrevibacter sp.]|uniref:50S ribosomal protein L18 n=1 Tax=Methanobrevibacter sp. TaxID=66852 RepID=UPI001B41C200|nr:50S ribosomal protein L18 [Methanobrevibacter sp.]MBP3792231.1 50S ribosomal protein L18 [Methanobrevibacter sp.]
MAQGTNYKVAFRRRRQGKTDYKARMNLVDYDKSRLVVRVSNAHATVQVIDYAPEGDITVASAVSKQLANYGYLGATGNISAFYLTAYLCAKRALAAGVENAILDIGLKSPIKGSKIFAALKGAVDAGLEIPHGDFIFPEDERIRGEHVANYAESLDAEEVAKKFSKYFERGLNPKDLPENFDETIKNIDEAEE